MKGFLVLFFITMCFCEDPFSILGIPALNPSMLFSDRYFESSSPSNENFKRISNKKMKKPQSSGKTIPKYLENAHLKREDGIQAVSRYLLADDVFLKKMGAIFDKTQFSGLPSSTPISLNPIEKVTQKVKSAGKIFFNSSFGDNDYEAYGVEEVSDVKLFGWNVYKVLMISNKSVNNHVFITICYPLDDMLVPIGVKNGNNCAKEASMVEEQLKRNSEIITEIRKSGLFSDKQIVKMDERLSAGQIMMNTLKSQIKSNSNFNNPINNNNYDLNSNQQSSLGSNLINNYSFQNQNGQNGNINNNQGNYNMNSIQNFQQQGNQQYPQNNFNNIQENFKFIQNSLGSSELNSNGNENNNLNSNLMINNNNGLLNNKINADIRREIPHDKISSMNKEAQINQLSSSNANISNNSPSIVENSNFLGSSNEKATISKIDNQDYKNLQESVSKMTQQLSALENKFTVTDQRMSGQDKKIFDIQSNLEKNFSKLDNVLEKLSNKLK